VANSGDTPNGTASIIDYNKPESPSVKNTVTVGLSPLGVAIDQDRALALVANNGSNTLSGIDLTVLLPGAVTTTTPTATTIALSGPPTAIAVDPNRALAVVTNLQNSGTTSVTGGVDVVNLASNPPVKSTTASVSTLSASLTGIVYDPAPTPALFYATSTQQNAVYSFNPDTSGIQTIRVGINPYSLGYNYQTGTLLTINSTSNTSSVVDTQNFKTRQTLGISSMSQFAIDVDHVTNISVIADQNNNRVVFLAMPR
jgi:DNA-binding beta-propeller fold protein YncE